MADVTPLPRRINWDHLRADEAERVIREWSKDGAKVIFGTHAFERMAERGIVRADAMRILRTGYAGQPERDVATGDWKLVMSLPLEGAREAGVVVAVLRQRENLYVVTVEWVD